MQVLIGKLKNVAAVTMSLFQKGNKFSCFKAIGVNAYAIANTWP